MNIKLDLETVTLGEWASAERASGLTIQEMLKSRTSQLLLAMYLQELRNSGEGRSWSELANLRLQDVSSSMPDSVSTGTPAK